VEEAEINDIKPFWRLFDRKRHANNHTKYTRQHPLYRLLKSAV
jgi:hypothetical protein